MSRRSWRDVLWGSPSVSQLTRAQYRDGEIGEEALKEFEARTRAQWAKGREALAARRFNEVGGVVCVALAPLATLALWSFWAAVVESAGAVGVVTAVGYTVLLTVACAGFVACLASIVVNHTGWKPAWREILETEKEAARTLALAEMLTELSEDPLDWPSWTLGEEYQLLNERARAALVEAAGEIEVNAVLSDVVALTDEEAQESISDLLESVRARGVARVESVTLRVPVHEVGDASNVLHARHQQLSQEYGNYLGDPREVLRRPALSDVRDPLTAEFIEAYANLTALPSSSVVYEAALGRAWKAWRAADAHARRQGLKGLRPQERKRVVTARKLLELALDPASTDSERASAYAQVEKLLEGLVELPTAARTALVSASRALTTA